MSKSNCADQSNENRNGRLQQVNNSCLNLYSIDHWEIWWKKPNKEHKRILMNHPVPRQGRCILANLAHLFCAIWFWQLKFKHYLLTYAWLFRIVLGVKRKKKHWTLKWCIYYFMNCLLLPRKITDRPGSAFSGTHCTTLIRWSQIHHFTSYLRDRVHVFSHSPG